MKKLLALILILALTLSLFGCSSENDDSDFCIAMIIGTSDIADQSFNQSTWEALKQFSADYGYRVKYYMPSKEDDAARIAATELAIGDGCDVIVLPGYVHCATIAELSGLYKDVTFIGLDIAESNILDSALINAGVSYSGNPDDYDLSDYVYMDNVYCATYQEQISGYMAGYGAVKLGYTKLGYLGGMAVPAVMRFGYGYVLGADAAAQELGITVDLKYAYANQFFGDADITAVMDTWYSNGTQVVFACGGGVWTSAAEAGKRFGGKVIGVDVDQSPVIDKDYGKGITLTSAMKGLTPTTYNTLVDVVINGNWENYSGKIEALGIVSPIPEENYVQLAPTTLFEDGKFSYEDYCDLVEKLYGGLIVSDNITEQPATTNVNVQWLGSIK